MIGTTAPPAHETPEEIEAYLRGFANRTTMLLGAERVALLRDKTVAIAGCGGVGGACAITLARMGVGGFVLADPGIFDPPDANRQWASTRVTLGRNKAEVHADILRQINPRVRLQVHTEGITEDNLDAFLAPADVLLDCLDISVPLSLRGKVYRGAMAKGIYGLTSPVFGFGTMIVVAEPGGMGMDELIDRFVRVASAESKLPAGFPDFFFPPHVDAIEGEIHKHRVPTCGISVTLSTGLVAAEIARILLRDTYPGLAGPPVLPRIFAVEPLRRTFRVVHYTELFRELARDRAAREAALAKAHHNVVLVPASAVEADRLSDSAADHAGAADAAPAHDADAGALLAKLYGYPYAFPVFRGRYAESLLAPLVVPPGRAVAMVAPFPTTRFHVEAAGARVIDVGTANRSEWGGNVDLDALAGALSTGAIGAIWLEPCNNALGGAPMSLANLRAVHALASAAGVPVVLDATRVWENAVLVKEREAPELSLAEIVLATCALSEACAASLTKDFRAPAGGFVGVRTAALADAVRDRTALMTGDGLGRDGLATLAGCLAEAVEKGVEAPDRVAAVRALAEALEAVGAPVVRPLGGHAVYIDAAAALPHLGPDEHADYVLANALFVESGVRVAPNMCTAEQSAAGQRWIRVAVPVGVASPEVDRRLVAGMAAVLRDRERLRGLAPAPGGPGGVLGAFARRFEVRS